ncbi:Uncharacterised protein [Mycobacteroides abscessus subsp. abscessus]|nr:Uncharacterised protein [Mycobacteroides abscessus subsp. abscessus]
MPDPFVEFGEACPPLSSSVPVDSTTSGLASESSACLAGWLLPRVGLAPGLGALAARRSRSACFFSSSSLAILLKT